MTLVPHASQRSHPALSGGAGRRPRTVVQSLLRSAVHSHANRRRARELAWEWVGAKWPRLLPSASEMERGHCVRAVPGQELTLSTSGDGAVWSLSVAYSERRGMRSWTTRAVVADADDADVMGLQTACSELPDAPLVIAPPRLLGLWVARLELADGAVAVLGVPRHVGTEQQLDAFCAHVLSSARTLPVIALTHKPNSRYFGVDPNGLAEAVRGLAHVACVDPALAPEVRHRLGEDFGLLAGAARIYAPHSRADAPLPDHPLVRRATGAAGAEPEDPGAFRRLLIRRVCAISVRAGAQRHAFP